MFQCASCVACLLVRAPFRSVMLTSFFSFSRAAGLKFRPWVSAMAPHWAVWLLAAGLWGLGIGAEMWWNLVPRKTVSSGGECLKHGRQGQREAGIDCWGKGEEGSDACLQEGAAAEELPPSMHLYTDMCGCGFLRNASGPRGPELVVLV